MKKVILLVVGIILLFSSISIACATTTKCPDCVCNVTCSADAVTLPGVWELVLYGRKTCGEITIIGGSSAMIEDQQREKTFFLLNKVKVMKQVESCN